MKTKPILVAIFAATVLHSNAANDLTNSLNTYSGSSQDNQPAHASVLALSGLEASFVADGFGAGAAFETIYLNDASAVLPEVPGIKFGGNRGNGDPQGGGNDGRNYMRTVETDYNTKNFTAFVTVKRSAPTVDANRRSVFFGLGTGALYNGGANPDQNTTNAAVYVELQNGFGNASRRAQSDTQGNVEIGYHALNQVSSDSMRMKMEYNSVSQEIAFSFDYDYVPGNPFTPDQIIPITMTPIQGAEWSNGDRASIFFGGDRSIVFTDLVIDATDPATPPTPSGLSLVSVGNKEVNLEWSSVAIPGTTFSIFRSLTAGVFAAPAIATGLIDKFYTDVDVSLVNGTPYYYRVTQTNTVAITPESAPSNEISATPASGAVAADGIVARNGGNHVLVIDWNDLVAPFDTYKVYRSIVAEGPFTEIAEVIPDSVGDDSRYIDETVLSGNSYYYQVKSVLGAQESAPSVTSSVAIPSVIEVFVDFNGETLNTGRGILGAGLGTVWNVSAETSLSSSKLNDSLGVVTSLGLDGGSSGMFGSNSGANVGGEKNTPGSQTLIDNYDVMQDYRYTTGARTYTFTGLAPNRKYDFYAYGYGDNPGGNTAFNVGGVRKQTKNPLGLTALTEGRQYVTFTFVTEADGSFSFDFGRPLQMGLADADGTDDVSALNGFQLVENASAVLQPLDLTAFSTASIDLSWGNVDGADSYEIFRSTTSSSDYTQIGTSPAASYSDATAIPGTTYYYVVKAVDGLLKSFTSAEASGMIEGAIADGDADGLSDADEALIGTNPNDASDFFVAKTSTVTSAGGDYNVSFVVNGAEGEYVIERSSSLAEGSWVEIGTKTTWTWTNGVLDNLTLDATELTPAPGGKEFFRAKGVTTAP
jgi:fibronectin type 3 domain-containing protein